MFMSDEPSPYDDVFFLCFRRQTKIDFLLSESNRFFEKDGFFYSSLMICFMQKIDICILTISMRKIFVICMNII